MPETARFVQATIDAIEQELHGAYYRDNSRANSPQTQAMLAQWLPATASRDLMGKDEWSYEPCKIATRGAAPPAEEAAGLWSYNLQLIRQRRDKTILTTGQAAFVGASMIRCAEYNSGVYARRTLAHTLGRSATDTLNLMFNTGKFKATTDIKLDDVTAEDLDWYATCLRNRDFEKLAANPLEGIGTDILRESAETLRESFLAEARDSKGNRFIKPGRKRHVPILAELAYGRSQLKMWANAIDSLS